MFGALDRSPHCFIRHNRNLLFSRLFLSVAHVSRLFAQPLAALATYNNTIQRKSMPVSFSDGADGYLAGASLDPSPAFEACKLAIPGGLLSHRSERLRSI